MRFEVCAAALPGADERVAGGLYPFVEVAGVVRDLSGEQDIRLGEALVGDTQNRHAGGCRNLRQEPRHSCDVLFEIGSSVRTRAGNRSREIEGRNDRHLLFGGRLSMENGQNAESSGKEQFGHGIAHRVAEHRAVEISPKSGDENGGFIPQQGHFRQERHHASPHGLQFFAQRLPIFAAVRGYPPRPVERKPCSELHRDGEESHRETEQAEGLSVEIVLRFRCRVCVVVNDDRTRGCHVAGQEVAPDHGEEDEAQYRRDTGNGGERLHQPLHVPQLNDLFDQERRNDRDAQGIEVALPAQAVGIEGEERKDERSDHEQDRHRPVICRPASAAPKVARRRGLPQPLCEVALFIVEHGNFRLQGENPRLVREHDALLFVGAVRFDLRDHAAHAFKAELTADIFSIQFRVHHVPPYI